MNLPETENEKGSVDQAGPALEISSLTVSTEITGETVIAKPIEYSPRSIRPRIKAAPSIRQIYWCDFELDPILPEIGKKRPAIIVSFKNTLHGPCTVVPTSTEPQTGDSAKWAHKLSVELEPGKTSWVVCNHLYTVSTARLQPLNAKAIPRLSEVEFDAINEIILRWLPRPKPK